MESLVDMIACRSTANRLLWAGLLVTAMLSSCQHAAKPVVEGLPFYNTAAFDAEWITPTDPSYAKIHTIDTFALTNQLGQTINNDSLKGHIYVANFFYTSCPGICPAMMHNLTALQDSFATNKQIKMVSFSVMPWVDSVARLHDYGAALGADATKWYLLTGSKERIYTLARQSYFAEKTLGVAKDTDQFLHTESMLLIDKKGRIRGIYNATQRVDIERVTDDIKTLLQEKEG